MVSSILPKNEGKYWLTVLWYLKTQEFFKRERAHLALLVIVFPFPSPSLSAIKPTDYPNYPKSTPRHSKPPNHTSPKNSKEFKRIMIEFPKNFQRIHIKFPNQNPNNTSQKNSQRIHKEFPKKTLKIYKLPKNISDSHL